MKYIKLLGLSILGIFAPIKPMLLAAFSLALLDLILGIMAAKKQGQRITSAGLKRTVGKIFLYELAIMVSYVGETYLLVSEFRGKKAKVAFNWYKYPVLYPINAHLRK